MKRVFVLTTLIVISLLLYGCTAIKIAEISIKSPGLKLAIVDYKFKEAIPLLEREYAADPNGIYATSQIAALGDCYVMVGQPEKTLALMKSALVKHRDSRPIDIAHFYGIKGSAYAVLRRYDEAIFNYKKALSHAESAPILMNLSMAYITRGEFDLAASTWQSAVSTTASLTSSKNVTSKKVIHAISSMQKAGNLDSVLESWKGMILLYTVLPNYPGTEDIDEEFLATPEQIKYIERQIEILEKKLHPQTFSGPSSEGRFDTYAESITQYLLDSSLCQGGKELSVAVGDFVKDRVDEKPKLGNMLATSLTEKFKQAGKIVVIEDDDTAGSFYLYGVIQDLGPIVRILTHIVDSEGKQAIASPEPLEIAKDSEVTELLQSM